MFYISLDTKEECLGYYFDGAVHQDLPEGELFTWDYVGWAHKDNVDYLKLYCHGKTMAEVCPPFLKREWEQLGSQRKSFEKAILGSKINVSDVCIYDIIPMWYLKELSQLKCEILEHVKKTFEKPKTYEFMLELEKLFAGIRKNTLNIDTSSLKSKTAQTPVRNLLKRIKNRRIVDYNQFGTVTGRLTVTSNSFPIMNLDKSFRSILKPNNDLFVEFDYNAAELRTILSLSDQQQPEEDIHQWNIKKVFKQDMTRDEAKRKIFSAIYNPNVEQNYYRIDKILNKFYDSGKIVTPLGREIFCDESHALNYVVQSTTSDLVLKQVLEVNKILEGKKSNILFLIHDSFVVDLSHEDRYLLPEIKNVFSKNQLGDYLVNVKAGRDFGSLRRVDI